MTLYDLSYPHDLRIALNKPTINTEEINAFLADPDADREVKRLLLLDVEPQGYTPPSDAGTGA